MHAFLNHTLPELDIIKSLCVSRMGMLQNHLEISDGNGDEFFCPQFGSTDHRCHR